MNSPVSIPRGSDSSAHKNGQFASTTVLSVLIVEDDAIIGMLLAEMLQKMGYNIGAVAATEEATVANFDRFKPSLTIVDEHLGAGNG